MNKTHFKTGFFLLFFCMSPVLFSQNVAINNNGSKPNPSAMLDVSSTISGFLPPRMTTAQMNAISSPATSLIVFNTTTNCLMIYLGTAWQNVVCNCTAPATPAVPSGTTSPSISAASAYTIAAVPGATNYTWSVSTTNGSVTGGQGTTSATITFSGTAATMNICVIAGNSCGSSASSCLSVTSTACTHGTVTFNYVSNATQSWSVPSCVSQVTVQLWAAGGGSAYFSYLSGTARYAGGSGAYITGVITGLTGQTLTLSVPSGGGFSNTKLSGGTGGWPGGGHGGYNPNASTWEVDGGGGGGYAAIQIGATYYVVAGAGGGGGSAGGDYYGYGGYGGATTGGNGGYVSYGCPGLGGTLTAGGAAGCSYSTCDTGTSGSFLTGGTGGGLACGGNNAGGGGGGGYYGGGGAGDDGNGAGGGSSYPGGNISGTPGFTLLSNLPGTTYTGNTSGGTALAPGSPTPPSTGEGIYEGPGGNGQIVITY